MQQVLHSVRNLAGKTISPEAQWFLYEDVPFKVTIFDGHIQLCNMCFLSGPNSTIVKQSFRFGSYTDYNAAFAAISRRIKNFDLNIEVLYLTNPIKRSGNWHTLMPFDDIRTLVRLVQRRVLGSSAGYKVINIEITQPHLIGKKVANSSEC